MIVAIAAVTLASLLPQDPPKKTGFSLQLRGVVVHTGTGQPWQGDFEAKQRRIVRPGDVLIIPESVF